MEGMGNPRDPGGGNHGKFKGSRGSNHEKPKESRWGATMPVAAPKAAAGKAKKEGDVDA